MLHTINGNLYFDINERIVCPVGKVVCFLRDLVKDIKASAIVGLFVRLCENIIRLGNRDRDSGVIDLDDFFARFILDAGTGVGGLGAAVVVVVDGEFDNELFAVVIRGIRLCRCCDAVFAVVETGHANLTVRPNGNAIGQCGFLRTPSVSRFVDRISRDAGRPFGSHQSKIGGDHVRQNCFCSKLTARNLRRDRLERLEQVNGAGRVHVVFSEIGAAVGYLPVSIFMRSRCIRVVGRHGTHIGIDIRGRILKDANGVNRGFRIT